MNDNQTLNVSDFINRQKMSGYQIRVALLCGLIALLDGFDTQSIAFVAPVIAQKWGLHPTDFGPVFALGMLGLMAGSMLFGPVADRFGRKSVLCLCLLIIGTFSFLTVLSDSISDLIIFRFLTGVGLGGAVPNILALTAEYSPRRLLSTTVTVMFCGFPLGAVLGGLIMSRVIPVYGWEIVFYAGGIFPLLMAPVIYAVLPESIRFLVGKKTEAQKIKKILTKINPALQLGETIRFALDENRVDKSYVKHLFAGGLARTTILLWVIYFMKLLIFYSLVNWLPTILKSIGVPIDKAILSTSIFNLGGIIGGILIGRLIDKRNKSKILTITFTMAALVISVIGFVGSTVPLLLFMVFISGFFVMGSTFGVQAFMTGAYSTSVRSTGVGWAMGIGRVGAIIGPMGAGILLSLEFNLSYIFILWALPALAAAAAMSFLKTPREREGTAFADVKTNPN